MDTNKKTAENNEIRTEELTGKEMEAASGCGPITGFGAYWIPGPRKKGENGDEQKDQ